MTEAEFQALAARVAALEALLQGQGAYVSKYSGEEIDALLDWAAAQKK
ncbi:MAG: hypothetical protein HFF31_05410 [Flavonifractor sp.]|jgi:hypothetical protein|nr:hypothetical protein [Flavonifractor sp.]